ncbi:hypothetical protein [Catenuloplanes atrovinosus]|uniref:Uncharacterized protein n=1 Tax=Catenuloplanes atrovinosus TaxID=137266 RepID=A0AAE4CAL9_9ACTN|nr:hypothetical protein [Catenuloplanes atrovinosus]MDR7275954.1 hypothetical protein [Catenuloplanes atrovinosus]
MATTAPLRSPGRARPGRDALVVDALDELAGPEGGVVELPHRMVWQAVDQRRFDLDDPWSRGRAYEIVLREAVRHEELRSLLSARLLRAVWADLHLPRGVRRAWQERFPQLSVDLAWSAAA